MSLPAFEGVLETCVYHDSAEREVMERFYGEALGLPEVARWEDGSAFRVGDGVVLLFDRERLAGSDNPIKAHGATGRDHVCMRTDEDGYADWKQRLAALGVAITHEQQWGDERRSFYFHDPAGNLLEIADGDIWPPAASP